MKAVNEIKTDDVLQVPAMPFVALMNAARNAIRNEGSYGSLCDLRKCVEALEGDEPSDEH